MDRSFKFWDRLASRYANQPLEDEEAYLEKLYTMKEHVSTLSDVLELGCGTGSTALLLGPQSGSYRAIDYSSSMIDIARDKAQKAHMDNVAFECVSFDDLQAQEATYDVVIGMNILHLLKDWREAIPRVYALLKPGGVFLSSTACIGDSDSPIRHISKLGGFMGLVPVLSVFTRDELTEALSGAGFKLFHEWQPDEKKALFVGAAKPMQVA